MQVKHKNHIINYDVHEKHWHFDIYDYNENKIYGSHIIYEPFFNKYVLPLIINGDVDKLIKLRTVMRRNCYDCIIVNDAFEVNNWFYENFIEEYLNKYPWEILLKIYKIHYDNMWDYEKTDVNKNIFVNPPKEKIRDLINLMIMES